MKVIPVEYAMNIEVGTHSDDDQVAEGHVTLKASVDRSERRILSTGQAIQLAIALMETVRDIEAQRTHIRMIT